MTQLKRATLRNIRGPVHEALKKWEWLPCIHIHNLLLLPGGRVHIAKRRTRDLKVPSPHLCVVNESCDNTPCVLYNL